MEIDFLYDKTLPYKPSMLSDASPKKHLYSYTEGEIGCAGITERKCSLPQTLGVNTAQLVFAFNLDFRT